jgi:site-specific DNA-methyltransferase (adenine-specific)
MNKIELYNANCLEKLKDIEDNSIDLILTDPPYKIIQGGCSNIKRKDEAGGIFNKRNTFTKDDAKTGKLFKHNDIKFSEWLYDIFRVLKSNTHCYIMVNDRNMQELLNEAEKVGFKLQNILIWDKGNHTPNRYYLKSFEFIVMFRKGNSKNINNMGTKNILRVDNIKKGTKSHPTEKPYELLEILINNSTNKNDIVLDPFAGTGSCGIACINTNRNFIGIELDDNYFKIAEDRINKIRNKYEN